MLVKIPKCVARRVAQSTRTTSHLRPDKGQPDVADHSHSGTQAGGWTARMSFKVIFDVGFYHRRELFNCKRDHIQETCMDCILDLKPQKGISRHTLKAMRGRIALRKHCVRNRQSGRSAMPPAKIRAGLLPRPNHSDGSGEAAAHVESEEFFRVVDLPRTSLVRKLLIRLKNLPNPGRPDGVPVGN
jgi:hypothetical protein